MPRSITKAVLVCVALTGVPDAHAARPLNTDDAAMLGAGMCQIEAYLRPTRSFDSSVRFDSGLGPSCNMGGWGEILVGLDRAATHTPEATLATFQIKKVFRDVAVGNPGGGFSIGQMRDASHSMEKRGRENAYANALFSIAPSNRLQFDLNAGLLHEWKPTADGRRNRFAWGFAGEIGLFPKWTLVAERTGSTGISHVDQIGLRTNAWSNRTTWDATLGRQTLPTGKARWLMVGVTIAFDHAPAPMADR